MSDEQTQLRADIEMVIAAAANGEERLQAVERKIAEEVDVLRQQNMELESLLGALRREAECAAACLEKIGRKEPDLAGLTSTTALRALLAKTEAHDA